ncbi:hypothetical protein ACW7BJ_16210 [Azospirillum argentinense]
MEIEVLREAGEDGGGFLGFWIKGHVDMGKFQAACVVYANDELYDHDRRDGMSITQWMVRQGWWRCVPMGGGEEGFFYSDAKPHSRGAFPVTYVNTSEIEVIKWKAEKQWDDETLWAAAADYSLDHPRTVFRSFNKMSRRKAGSLVALNTEHAMAIARGQVGHYAENFVLTPLAA